MVSRSVLLIKADAIRHNVSEINRFSGKRLIAVVKSNAYGIGMEEVVKIIGDMEAVDSFAVACVEEGVLLREMGVKKEVLVLGGILPDEASVAQEYDLTPVVSDIEHLRAIANRDVRFHVKYDTGMGRLGFVESFIDDPRLVGVMSHLSTPSDREYSLRQIETFGRIVGRYGRKGLKIHIESSAGVIYRVPYTTHVRVGLALYGEKPLKDYPLNLRPALTLVARLLSVKELPAGHPVSYGRTYITPGRMRVGVVAFGYGDGLMKSLSGKGYLLFKDKKLPILGSITMDMTVVGLGDLELKAGDWVQIVCEQRTFGELAKEAGTIPYELMCNLSDRIKREII